MFCGVFGNEKVVVLNPDGTIVCAKSQKFDIISHTKYRKSVVSASPLVKESDEREKEIQHLSYFVSSFESSENVIGILQNKFQLLTLCFDEIGLVQEHARNQIENDMDNLPNNFLFAGFARKKLISITCKVLSDITNKVEAFSKASDTTNFNFNGEEGTKSLRFQIIVATRVSWRLKLLLLAYVMRLEEMNQNFLLL